MSETFLTLSMSLTRVDRTSRHLELEENPFWPFSKKKKENGREHLDSSVNPRSTASASPPRQGVKLLEPITDATNPEPDKAAGRSRARSKLNSPISYRRRKPQVGCLLPCPPQSIHLLRRASARGISLSPDCGDPATRAVGVSQGPGRQGMDAAGVYTLGTQCQCFFTPWRRGCGGSLAIGARVIVSVGNVCR